MSTLLRYCSFLQWSRSRNVGFGGAPINVAYSE
ncbi:hypothetical protein AHF37_00468 [Paragonimus kellicotti]|nr:hypothetical protein AHF37_00468 [Paragonimus kellicotti]